MDFREIRAAFLEFFRKKGHEVVESSSLVPREDPTLLFTNAGMVQFKKLFLGEEKRHYKRAATCQKCMRAGGKHNDLENVGYTHRHHTFFEMLGNFSFGDYFKREAINWAWELLTDVYKLDREKLHVSVYEEDDEAFGIWETEIGLPSQKIVRLGKESNFWAMGDTGPCGPCSEIYYDLGPEMGCGNTGCRPGCDCDRYLEVWNLVFTQFDRSPEGRLTPLSQPNIDTGMGLERISSVIQGVRSNFETDLFRPIIHRIEELSGIGYGNGKRGDISFRVIADHTRAVVFLVADGIVPSNEGRGYVLRRVIRRAIRFGLNLGLKEGFMWPVAEKVIELMSKDYPEVERARNGVKGVILNEEKRFHFTLEQGMKALDNYLEEMREKGLQRIPGEWAFKLYDTYGLSLDILQDVAREQGLGVDLEGFNSAMEIQRARSQEAWKTEGAFEVPHYLREMVAGGLFTPFLGYETLSAQSRVLKIFSQGKEVEEALAGQECEILLEESPFYGEGGGQVGDGGLIVGKEGDFSVLTTKKYGQGILLHVGRVEKGRIKKGERVFAEVSYEERLATMRHHTSTHLLHSALRDILGDHVKQAGSLVSPTRLRFDFTHFQQVDPQTLREIEEFVNRAIQRDIQVKTRIMKRQEAMESGAMAIFEEKYGEEVRAVEIEGVSRELCGGTHVSSTGQIGIFKILGETGIASNVRRIEAL
ncbi:MAG: alanine--tRNA ligase, partial [Desulfatiglandales bacterium]